MGKSMGAFVRKAVGTVELQQQLAFDRETAT
jgi:hypothetical protein